MLTRVSVPALMFALCFSSCRSASVERSVIGSWYYAPTIDARPGITLYPDHRFTVWLDDFGGVAHSELQFGRWHLDGGDVVLAFEQDFASRQTIGELHRDFVPFQRRESIEEILSRKRAPYNKASNQAMQLTAPRSVSPLSVARTFNLQRRAVSGAVADLVSR